MTVFVAQLPTLLEIVYRLSNAFPYLAFEQFEFECRRCFIDEFQPVKIAIEATHDRNDACPELGRADVID